MSHTKQLRFLVLALAPFCFCTPVRAQSDVAIQSPQAPVSFTMPNYDDSFAWPLNIVAIKAGAQSISIGRPVTFTNPAWLTTLVIEAKNISSKTIVEACVEISFLDSGKGTPDSPRLADQIHAGVYPDIALVHPDGTSTPRSQLPYQSAISIPPGGTIRFSFAGSGQTLAAMNALGMPIKTVRLQFVSVYFSDTSKWKAGSYAIPTSSSNTWREVNRTEFEQFGKPR